MTRYPALFSALAERNEGAFVPFVMLGDPNYDDSLRIIRTLIDAGADALELGVPFSDPVADGPTIQRAHLRASAAGINMPRALELVREIRNEFPDIPIGLLIYGNLAFSMGFEEFYSAVADSGADSVLLPDIPIRESAPFREAAERHGIDQVFIAPPHSTKETLQQVAQNSRGYIYAVSRLGVTGTERESSTTGLEEVVRNAAGLSEGGDVSRETLPVLLGFGISTPQHVADAVAAGAQGAICGSAITKLIEDNPALDDLDASLRAFVGEMKAATRR